MSLTIWRPRTQLDPWRRLLDLDTDFDSFLSPFFHRRGGNGDAYSWLPAIDVRETEEALVVEADVPGLGKDDLEITVLDDVLTIKGEKKREHDETKENYHRLERHYGSFQRSITLPSSVDSTKVAAQFKNGVLHIDLPKREEAKPREIKVEVG